MSTKFDIPKFDDKISFAIWQIQMKVVLTQLVVQKALQTRPADMTDDKWYDINERALSAIQLSLSFDVLHKVMYEKSATTLWNKLKDRI
jgi:pyruvate/oxaloacetate carboxyltransferase